MEIANALPSTTERVERHSSASIRERNRQAMEERVALYAQASREEISERIEALKHEWDMERALEANAATVSLIGVGLAAFVDRRWLVLPGVVAGFLLQHALQGWCPPVPVLRRLGVRTQREINEEITALRILRGDFEPTRSPADAVQSAVSPPH